MSDQPGVSAEDVRRIERQLIEGTDMLDNAYRRIVELEAENARLREGWLAAECESCQLAPVPPDGCEGCRHGRGADDYCGRVRRAVG